MAKRFASPNRRRFLRTAFRAGAALMAPRVISGAVLGKDGAVSPSERIVVGGIGIGNRGQYMMGCFLPQPDVQFVAVCDIRASRRTAVKAMVDQRYGNADCDTYRDFRDLLARPDIDAVLIATGPNWHGLASVYAARAGKDVYCEKPCTKTIAESLVVAETMRRTGRVYQAGTQRRNLPHFAFACELARTGRLGKLTALHAKPGGMATGTSGWTAPAAEPAKEEVDWDLYLGPAAWRPFHPAHLNGFEFEKGGGLVGGGILEWGAHTVDLCQWAADADATTPVEYHPPVDGRLVARYADGVELVVREDGWKPLGSCPIRFEGEDGWIETGDSGRMALSSPDLLAGREVAEIGGYPATFHVRDFLDCIKTRNQPLANAQAACSTHIACHVANITLFLGRTVAFDPVKHEFPGNEEANRLRSEALRAPWRL